VPASQTKQEEPSNRLRHKSGCPWRASRTVPLTQKKQAPALHCSFSYSLGWIAGFLACTICSPFSGCVRFPAMLVRWEGVSSFLGWNSHTKPSVRRRLGQSLNGNLRSIEELYTVLKYSNVKVLYTGMWNSDVWTITMVLSLHLTKPGICLDMANIGTRSTNTDPGLTARSQTGCLLDWSLRLGGKKYRWLHCPHPMERGGSHSYNLFGL
jgi:hypothetical protein